jgi:hypothetical protein
MGTGFLVSNRIIHLIMDCKSITPRIFTLRMRGKFLNYSHGPTEIPDDEEKDGGFLCLRESL